MIFAGRDSAPHPGREISRLSYETPFVYPAWRGLVVGLTRRGIVCLRSSVSMSFVLGAGPLTRAGGLRALHIDASSLRQGWQLSRKAGVKSGRPLLGHCLVAVRGVHGLVVSHAARQTVPQHFQPTVPQSAQRGIVAVVISDVPVVELPRPCGPGQRAVCPELHRVSKVTVAGQPARYDVIRSCRNAG